MLIADDIQSASVRIAVCKQMRLYVRKQMWLHNALSHHGALLRVITALTANNNDGCKIVGIVTNISMTTKITQYDSNLNR